MLDECDVDYEIVHIDLEKGEHKAPDFLEINPAGKLPALVDGNSRIFENAAICLYLGDKFPEANLAAKIGTPERGRYLSLMVYSTSQLEPAMSDMLMGTDAPTSQRGWTNFGELGDGPYLFGDWFTAADVMVGSMFVWKRMFGGPPGRPKLEAYVDRLLERSAGMKAGG